MAAIHDHKFDAISSRDYYALSGFLQSSDYRQVRFETIETERKIAAELDAINRQYQSMLHAELIHVLEGIVRKNVDAKLESSAVKNMMAWDDKPARMKNYRTLVDYRQVEPPDFIQDGFIFGSRPTLAGDLVLAENDGQPTVSIAAYSAARNDPFWNRLENVSETVTQEKSGLDYVLRSGRTLRTPTLEFKSGEVYVQLRGSGLVVACVDSHRQVAGPLHNETIQEIKPAEGEEGKSQPIRWHRMDLTRYQGHRAHFEFTPAPNTILEILRVVEIEFKRGTFDDREKVLLSSSTTSADEESTLFSNASSYGSRAA